MNLARNGKEFKLWVSSSWYTRELRKAFKGLWEEQSKQRSISELVGGFPLQLVLEFIFEMVEEPLNAGF